jgi:uncharacterized membrane protein
MNTVLWGLQILGALLYLASGVMKVFMFDRISHDVPSFGAMPRSSWGALGIVEIACALGLVVPGILHAHLTIAGIAAAILAVESLVFIWVHVKYREIPPIIFSAVLGLLMAFVAYGRLFMGAAS